MMKLSIAILSSITMKNQSTGSIKKCGIYSNEKGVNT